MYKEWCEKLLLNDVGINPNITTHDLDKISHNSYAEVFKDTYLVYKPNIIKHILTNNEFTTREIGFGNYKLLFDALTKSKVELEGDVLFSDGEQHQVLRNILVKAYNKIHLSSAEIINRIVDEHLSSLINNSICLINDIATPISEKLFLELSGIGLASDYHKYSEFFNSMRILMNGIDNNFSNKEKSLSDHWMYAFTFVLNILTNGISRHGLMEESRLIDQISKEQKVIMILGFIRAGIENPRSYIVSAIIRYFNNKELFISNKRAFLDEVMRYDCPAKITARYISKDAMIDNCFFKAGKKVWLSFRIANFDKTYFSEPLEFKLRESNKNFALGYGAHFCIGKELTFKVTEKLIYEIERLKFKLEKFNQLIYTLDKSYVFRRYKDPIRLQRGM